MPLSFDDTSIAFHYRNNHDLFKAKWLFTSMANPFLTKWGTRLTQWAFKNHLPIERIIKQTIFKQFCGGENIEEAGITAQNLAQYGVGVILDYSVEGKEAEAEFDLSVNEFIKAIDFAASQKNIPFISVKITGFSRFELLEKWHKKEVLSNEENDEKERVINRINQVCNAASSKHIKVLIDAEESWIQGAVDELANQMMQNYNQTTVLIYNTFQLYCHDRLSYLKSSMKQAIDHKYLLGAKLVRGAYMEKERARALELNYPSPIQPNKEKTDIDYNNAVSFCLNNLSYCALFIGTHNEYSCKVAAEWIIDNKLPLSSAPVYFSQLYGMSDNISFNLAHSGFQVAKYLPYGPVKDVIPYLMRRAQENTSVAGQTGRELALIKKELKRRKQD